MHPDAHIYHKGGGSFGRGRAFRELARRNRNLYYSRYPNARRNVLLLSGNTVPAHFPSNLMDAVENVFHEGGYVHWLTPEPSARLLPCLQMRHGFRLELMLRGWRADKRISEVWVLPETPRVWRALLSFWVLVHGLKVLLWKEVATTEV